MSMKKEDKFLIAWMLIIVALILLLMTFAIPAKAAGFAEFGSAWYERPQGSLWQQDFAGYPTEWNTRTNMFRVGVEYGYARLSYFDLGTYSIQAEAADDEGSVEQCKCMVGGDTDWYYTTGSIRGITATLRGTYKGVFIEGGPARFRQSFKVRKDDGFEFQERRYGYGYVVGIGYEFQKISVGAYSYQANIAGEFEDGKSPTGTGGAYAVTFSMRF